MLHGCYTVSLLVQLCLSGAYSKTQVTPWKRFHQSLTKKNIAPLLDHLTNVCRTSVNIGWNHKERNLSIFFYFLYCHCILVVALSLVEIQQKKQVTRISLENLNQKVNINWSSAMMLIIDHGVTEPLRQVSLHVYIVYKFN